MMDSAATPRQTKGTRWSSEPSARPRWRPRRRPRWRPRPGRGRRRQHAVAAPSGGWSRAPSCPRSPPRWPSRAARRACPTWSPADAVGLGEPGVAGADEPEPVRADHDAGAHPTETPEPEPTPTETPEPSTPPPAAEPAPEPTPEAPPEPVELARGATGERVVALQQRLADLGYFIGAPDGDFGGGTQQAVWALQKAAGLSRDGVVGPATQAALDEGVTPQPRSGSGKVVEIDLDRQLLLAVEDGRVVTVVNASSGNGESYEAKGAPTAPARRAARSRWAGRSTGTTRRASSSATCGAPSSSPGIAVHGSGSILPWPASHGCVRVANSAMNWLWDTWRADPGTTVLVY